VTVVFADIAGSMALAEGTDPEDWAAIMDRFFRVLSEGIARFGGTVDKFTGDGVMALFGAPVSQEDHARRACLAALYLRAAADGLALPVRIGLNSGEVVVGGIGHRGRLDYTALGHTVGLAQRMEALADPGAVFLSEGTARLVHNDFVLRDLGVRTVKGSSEPLRVFVLEASRRRRPTVGSTVLVGRAEEMGVLEAALGRALEGQAQVVGVVGEAGVGKSRLCEEFARSATARGITVRRTAGLSHAQEVPLLPVLEFLRDYFGIDDTDSRAEAQEKIARRLLALDPGFQDSLPLMFDFLEVPDEARPVPQMSPEVRMERIFAVIRRITQRRSDREALILLFEDLHWFDPLSRAFVERLVPSFPGTRTLLLTNFRPEFSPPWASHSYYRQLPLQPLDGGAVGRLLEGLLGRDDSLGPLVKLIADTTGGSPFFIEEVVRSLVEDGTLAGEPAAYRVTRAVEHLAVPSTVQATLAARIDRLAEADRALLQTAAVIGRNFTEPVVRLVSRVTVDDLAGTLGRLCAAEFLQEVTADPVEEYRFWHPLTQEVAYQSLLRERRAALHGAVAEAIVATDADRLDERAALIAVHYERAGNSLEAARWHDRAGLFALRRDLSEAMRRWRAVLAHLASAPDSYDAEELGIFARTRLIRYGARTGTGTADASQLYAEARAMAARSGDPARLAMVTHAYATPRFWRGSVAEAMDLYREASDLADQTGRDDARVTYGVAFAVVAIFAGSSELGAQAIEEVARLSAENAEFGRRIYGFSPLSPLALARAELFALRGEWKEAREALDQGLAIARAGVEPEWIAWLLSVIPRLARSPGEFEASLTQADEALRVAEDCGNTASRVVALGAVGIAQLGLGNNSEACDVLNDALDEARSRQAGLFEEARLLVYLAQARFRLGDRDAAWALANEAIDIARRQGTRVFECFGLLSRARIIRGCDGPADDVAADLGAALALAREIGASAYAAEIEAETAQ
jgi:adenylate cyclase